MKVWLPKFELARKNNELWKVHYEEPSDPEAYHLIEVPEFKMCDECWDLIANCYCDREDDGNE